MAGKFTEIEPGSPAGNTRSMDAAITDDDLARCVAHGVRTSVPHGYAGDAWVHKYMLHGLHVVVDPRTGSVLRVHWAVPARGSDGKSTPAFTPAP